MTTQRPDRVHITGGAGSGKTSLAKVLAARTGWPVYHLDQIARAAGPRGVESSPEERLAAVQRIIAEPCWITEGVHTEWTADLIRAADVVVWLDYVSWRRAARRIVARFVRGAVAETRHHRGIRKFTRFRDYGHQLTSLFGLLVEAWHYYRPGDRERRGRIADSHEATARLLAGYNDKVVRCRSSQDVAEWLGAVAPKAAAR